MPLPRIAIATGDPAGIGPEIALKAALDARVRAASRPLLVGDPAAVEMHARAAGLAPELQRDRRAGRSRLGERRGQSARCARGRQRAGRIRQGRRAPTAAPRSPARAAPSRRRWPARSKRWWRRRRPSARSPPPASHFDGYPSFVARETGTPVEDVYLMICFDDSRIVHATLHLSVREALEADHARARRPRHPRHRRRAEEARHRQAEDFRVRPQSACRRRGPVRPEEIEIIAPAIATPPATASRSTGPFGADTMFRKKGCDAFIVMLHDQGHIAAKLWPSTAPRGCRSARRYCSPRSRTAARTTSPARARPIPAP